MKRLLSTFLFCCTLIIVAFLLFGDVERWAETNLNSDRSVFTYTALSFTLLLSDILFPVPSSLIMVLNGKILGLLPGTLVSLVAGLLSSSIGFFLGRRTSTFLNKVFTARDKKVSDNLFDKFGNTAIAISKALPVLSEAVSVVSGTTSISFQRFLVYSFVGHLTVSLLYAYVGSYSSSLDSSLVAGVVIISALLISWLIQYLLRKRSQVTG